MVQQLFKQPLSQLWKLLSWHSGEARRSRRKLGLPATTSQSLSTIFANSTLRSLSEISDDFAAETASQSWQSTSSSQPPETRIFSCSIRVDEVITASNLTVKALNRQLTQERRVLKAAALSSRQNLQSCGPEASVTPKAAQPKTQAPILDPFQKPGVDHVTTAEPPLFVRKKGVVKLLFKLKKRNYHGYVSPDDGSPDIIFHQKYVGIEIIDRLERGMQVEVIARQIAGKVYAERLRMIEP